MKIKQKTKRTPYKQQLPTRSTKSHFSFLLHFDAAKKGDISFLNKQNQKEKLYFKALYTYKTKKNQIRKISQ